jgi:hypothetical protein
VALYARNCRATPETDYLRTLEKQQTRRGFGRRKIIRADFEALPSGAV